ncbi:MAG: DinB family protein [Saprospiraceae bacterium]|nr:DinB family protein [Saprospiraceae bacterium]MCF8252755.1 DinB family protein [Saprospiraceae bacterium]MCF8283127.1 DinB family protein [Bacteroidales bacterium]MCF8314309.1 DinB family protein [Saprospiraceae bacterium]MCF8443182.1 DinB family protein [Saprospiraceae bacterium]
MLKDILKRLFLRDLSKLKTEIAAYQNEEVIWYTEKNIANSAGNLCLHLAGNINHFIGAEMGNTSYVRQRDLEFSLKNVPRAELLEKVDATIEIVGSVLDKMTDEEMAAEFPNPVFQVPTTAGQFMVHLAVHLDYHLGQVNYHRRLLDA